MEKPQIIEQKEQFTKQIEQLDIKKNALETELRIIKDNIQQLVGAIKAADLFVDLDSKEKTVEPTSTKEKPTVTDKNK